MTGKSGNAMRKCAEFGTAHDRVRDTSVRPERPVLGEFNRLFHDLYTAREERVIERLESGEIPVVVRMDDRLILLAGDEVTEYVITAERYHELKAASHIPAAVHLALAEPSAECATRLMDGLDALADNIGDGAGAIVSATRALLEQGVATRSARARPEARRRRMDQYHAVGDLVSLEEDVLGDAGIRQLQTLRAFPLTGKGRSIPWRTRPCLRLTRFRGIISSTQYEEMRTSY